MTGTRTVAWMIDSLRLAGAERLAVEFAADPPEGWRVELIALQAGDANDEAWGEALRRLDGRLHLLRMRRLGDVAEFTRLVQLLRRLRPDLLHTHLDYATAWGGAAGMLLRIPHVSTMHVMPKPAAGKGWNDRLREAAIGAGWRRARRLVFVSEDQRQQWQSALGAGACARVVANGTASAPAWTREERQRWRAAMGLPLDGWVVTTVAMVRTAKGWQDWLRAAELVAAERPDVRFVWVGGGSELEPFRQAAASSSASSQIALPGARADVSDWLRGSDLFVLPSHGEALPTAVLEAAAHRLPVVASNLPAVREILGDAGAYCPVGDGQALAARILAWPPGSMGATGAAREAHRRWAQGFSFGVWKRRLVDVYQECLAPDASTATAATGQAAGGSPTRILMIEFFARSGLYHYAWQLTAALGRRSDTDVHLLTGRSPEVSMEAAGVRLSPQLWIWNSTLRPTGVPRWLLRAWRGGRYIVAWLQALQAVRRECPEVVLLTDFEHACDGWFVERLRRMSRRRGFVLADIWHNVEAFQRNHAHALVRHLNWRDALARRFDVVFVHGRNLAMALEERTGVRAHVIPHGNQTWIQQLAGPDPKLSVRLALPARKPVVLLFGALSPYKGVEVLIQALARVAPKRRPAAIIAGMPTAGARPRAWRALARQLQLDAWLRWDERYIPTEEIAWYFQCADVVVLPYLTASQSGVAHLALTFGKPLIVTACGGLPELIDGNGVVVAPGDVEALATALDQFSNDIRLRHRLGRRSRELSITRHNWDEIAATMLAAIKAAGSGAGTSAPVELRMAG